MPTTITDRDWEVLVESLRRHACAVLVGPGLSIRDGAGVPRNLSIALSQQLAAELETKHRFVVADPTNLPLVAECFVAKTSRADLEIAARDFYREALAAHVGSEDPTFTALAALPVPLFVSSRHDLVLEHYLQRYRPGDSDYYNLWGDARPTRGAVGTVERPLVYHLLGSPSEPASLVVAESELLDLLRAIASATPALPRDLLNALAAMNCLFIGCGLHAYYTRVLLHMLELSRSRHRSFGLDPIPANMERNAFDVEYQRGVWFYEVGYKMLKLIDLDEQTFIRELRGRWERAKRSAAPVTSIAARPLVFLSYVSKDQRDAVELEAALQRHGVDTWLDKDRLKSGERWSDEITDAIAEKVHFFVVLHSTHLSDDVETFVHREIDLAIKRGRKRGQAMKFIYPVSRVANACPLKALEDLQVQHLVDLTADVAHLAADIQQQFAKLRRG